MSFHTRLTSRASWYAPPDTGVSDLKLVAVEYLPSIEGADQICWSAPFCVGNFSLFAGTKCLPLGEGAPKGRMREGEHLHIASQFHQTRDCSPALIRLLRFAPQPPSPRGRHGPAANPYSLANFERRVFFCRYSKATTHKSGVPYQAARSQTPVRWPPSGMPDRNIGACLKSEAACTKP